jgi:hypothetical protein
VSDAAQFEIDRVEYASLSPAFRLAPELEAFPLPLDAADVRKTGEAEYFGLSFAASPPASGIFAEVYESCLLGSSLLFPSAPSPMRCRTLCKALRLCARTNG